ncbi:hypothetical protein PACTADRAFT_49609 [Pachysolen tannophilus NRRL Y-2460]|uniref:HIT-type domain-containing protein n=1 Tax=Pachysolen tannophilus NRRL Y-2460 TaxID=669874 RepID=A0A1E4TWQ4_PACTA|nr:hypothetical protein PACTADRAFT_49609 [Pachysolen tannophilus NRRL Y-2460]
MSSKLCGICNSNESRYKCPKCGIKYCSVTCFKSEAHIHDHTKETDVNGENVISLEPQEDHDVESGSGTSVDDDDKLFQKLLNDPKIKALLQEKTLRFHLTVLFKILNDPKILSKEYDKENRLEIANKKLVNLRVKGIEENELVEEFCCRVIELLEEDDKRDKNDNLRI